MTIPHVTVSFFTVFLAEMGDKTQLATMALGGTSGRPLMVFWGSMLALLLASLIGATAGGAVATVVDPVFLQIAAAIGFLLQGLRLLMEAGATSMPDNGDG